MKTLFYTLLGGVTAVVGLYLFAIVSMWATTYMTYKQMVLLIFFIFGCIIGYAIVKNNNDDDNHGNDFYSM